MEIFGKDKDCLTPALKMLKQAVSYSEVEIQKNPLIFTKI